MAQIDPSGLEDMATDMVGACTTAEDVRGAAVGGLHRIGRSVDAVAVATLLESACGQSSFLAANLRGRAEVARRVEARRWAAIDASLSGWDFGVPPQPSLSDDDDYTYGELPTVDYALWGPDGMGSPDLSDINQGALGDCWALAGIGAVAHNDPDIIRDNITENADGTYTVTFYRRTGFNDFEAIEVTVDGQIPLTDKGMAAYAKPSTDGELWAVIYEKAYAEFRGGSYEDIEGGSAQVSLEAVTGEEFDRLDPKDMDDVALAAALGDGAVAVGMRNPRRIGGWVVPWDRDLVATFENLDVQDSHQYVVESVDQVDGEWSVTLYNPWGDTHHRPVLTLDELRSVSDEVDVVHTFEDPLEPLWWTEPLGEPA